VIDQKLKEQFIAALKEKGRFKLRTCSICSVPLYYFVHEGSLFFDSNCDCSSYCSDPKPSDWAELDFYLEPEHGHITKIQAFIGENK